MNNAEPQTAVMKGSKEALTEPEETQTPTVPLFSGQRWDWRVKGIKWDNERACEPTTESQLPVAPVRTMSPSSGAGHSLETQRIHSFSALVSGGKKEVAVLNNTCCSPQQGKRWTMLTCSG